MQQFSFAPNRLRALCAVIAVALGCSGGTTRKVKRDASMTDDTGGSGGSAPRGGMGGSPPLAGRGGTGGGGAGSGGQNPDAAAGGSGGGGAGGGAGGAGGARDAAASDATRDAVAADAARDAARPDGVTMTPGKVSWTTYKFDNNRTGWNPFEKVLTPALLADPAKFGKLFTRPVDGQIYAQPLYVSGLVVGGKTRNVVFVVTQTNNAYAFDADDAAQTMPLWTVNFGKPITPDEVNACCTDIAPLIGTTATPVIDMASKTIYLTTKTNENGAYVYKLHALDLTTGMEKNGAPATFSAMVAGSADGSTGGMLKFDPRIQLNRPALLLQAGSVYVAFASHTDSNNYHGWVFSFDAATMQQKNVFCTAANKGHGAGVWQSGNGLVGDGQSIFFATGNAFGGGSDPNANPPQLGESMVRLDNALALKDWGMRGNYTGLDNADADYGSSGPLLIPGADELIMAGKDSAALVYDKNNLGHWKANDTDAVVQKFTGTGAAVLSGPHSGGWVYWEGPNGATAFAWPGGSKLLGFKLGADKKFVTTPAVVGPDSARTGIGSGIMTISSDGANNGILWTTIPEGDVGHGARLGTLRAYSPVDGKLLWRSDTNKTRDDIGFHAKESPPTIANGKVYVASWNGTTLDGEVPNNSKAELAVYGGL